MDLRAAVALPDAALAALVGVSNIHVNLPLTSHDLTPSMAPLAAQRLQMHGKLDFCTLELTLQSAYAADRAAWRLHSLKAAGFHRLKLSVGHGRGRLSKGELQFIGSALGQTVRSITFGAGAFSMDIWEHLLPSFPHLGRIALEEPRNGWGSLDFWGKFKAFCASVQHTCEVHLPYSWRHDPAVQEGLSWLRKQDMHHRISVTWQPPGKE
jgi:hypothetical protein